MMDLDIMVDDGGMGWAVIYANLIPEGKGKVLWKLFTIVWKGKRREETPEKGNSHSTDINTGLAQVSFSLLSPRLPAPWPLCSSLSAPSSSPFFSSPSVQWLSRVWLFVTPWIAACQASLSITNSKSLLKLMSIQLVMPSNHLILCRPLLLLPSIFPALRSFLMSQFFTSCGQSIGASA